MLVAPEAVGNVYIVPMQGYAAVGPAPGHVPMQGYAPPMQGHPPIQSPINALQQGLQAAETEGNMTGYTQKVDADETF